jgi:hypothetical protein
VLLVQIEIGFAGEEREHLTHRRAADALVDDAAALEVSDLPFEW